MCFRSERSSEIVFVCGFPILPILFTGILPIESRSDRSTKRMIFSISWRSERSSSMSLTTSMSCPDITSAPAYPGSTFVLYSRGEAMFVRFPPDKLIVAHEIGQNHPKFFGI